MRAALDRLPAMIVLWGVEVISTEPGVDLSPALTAMLPRLETELYQDLKRVALKTEV